LWALAAGLPAVQLEVLALRIQGELTFKEIADICGISLNTAASRYRYALEKLKLMVERKT
jgi:RNA polymerase sigma-70 factor (ECF subfamily)